MKIFINADSFKEIALKTKDDLIRYCEELDIEIAKDISEADILFSIGGDGTFLNTAKMTGRPIIGINTGTLGYLTEVNPDDLQKALKSILSDNYTVENRMMVEGKIIKSSVLRRTHCRSHCRNIDHYPNSSTYCTQQKHSPFKKFNNQDKNNRTEGQHFRLCFKRRHSK